MSIKESQQLKSLQSRKAKLQTEISSKDEERNEIVSSLETLRQRLRAVESEIESLLDEGKEPVVSEHAMLRYFERVMGVDLHDIRERILTDQIRGCIRTMGKGKFPSGTGFRAVVQNNTVVTVEKD